LFQGKSRSAHVSKTDIQEYQMTDNQDRLTTQGSGNTSANTRPEKMARGGTVTSLIKQKLDT
jgi:hypothetical protein